MISKRNLVWLAVIIAVGVAVGLVAGVVPGLVAAAVVLVGSEIVERVARARRRAEGG
jgi:hypothetical protein